MKKRILNLYRALKRFFYEKPKLICKLILKSEYYNGETYFPEVKNRKGKLQIFYEQFRHVLKYNELNEYYFLYGLDLKDRNPEKYVPYLTFMNRRNDLNKLNNNDAISILRNKVYFSIITEKFGFKTPKVLGIYSQGSIKSLNDDNDVSLTEFFSTRKNLNFFFKSIDGERGDGVFKICLNAEDVFCVNDVEVSMLEVKDLLNDNRYLIQQQLMQSSKLNKLHDKAINTLRLVTIFNKEEDIKIIQPILRVGTNEMVVDNWSQGGNLY